MGLQEVNPQKLNLVNTMELRHNGMTKIFLSNSERDFQYLKVLYFICSTEIIGMGDLLHVP